MRFTFFGAVLALGVLAASFAACGDGGTTSSTTTTGGGGATSSSSASSGGTTSGGGSMTTGTGGGTSTSTASSTATSSASGSSSGSSTGTGAMAYGYCTKACGVSADCCPPGLPNCPSNMYPTNYHCDKSACRPPECMSTADCTMVNPKQDCLSLSGFNSCVDTCMTDGDCTLPQTCSGMDDNGKKYCNAMGTGCTDDASCNGFGKCVNKVCVCAADMDCTKAGFTKCAL